MREKDESEMLCGILQAADRHPNSRVAKLIRSVEEERSQKNIVMLLIELADHAEYATDFNISLRYYLDLFEKLGVGRDIVLNEAGLLLLNSSKIYSKRVDYVHELVEHQMLSLTKTDQELVQAKNTDQSTAASEKPKRARKRLVEASNDPYEIELIPKKLRKICDDKRFQNNNSSKAKTKTLAQRLNETEQHIHPAGWMHSAIVDFENEEEVDSKRNYKVFTYHVEHRYNTLVPDINFRLHFKVKDYIDEEQERLEEEYGDGSNCPVEHTRVWPPLSAEYVDKYLTLENQILEQEIRPLGKVLRISARNEENSSSTDDVAVIAQEKDTTMLDCSEALPDDSGLGRSFLDNTHDNSTTTNLASFSQSMQHTDNLDESDNNALPNVQNSHTESLANESSFNNSLLDISSKLQEKTCADVNLEQSTQNDSALGESMAELSIDLNGITQTLDDTEITLEQSLQEQNSEAIDKTQSITNEAETGAAQNTTTATVDKNDESSNADSTLDNNHADEDPHKLDVAKRKCLLTDDTQIDLNEVRLMLPQYDDEGVFLSDLDEQDRLLLSPIVMATDVFPAIQNKKHFTVIVDDEIRALLNITEDEPETYELPLEKRPIATPIKLNILKIPEKVLKKRVLFKLGPDMDLYLRARSLKRPHATEDSEKRRHYKMLKWFSLKDTDMSGVHFTPNATPCHESEYDFAGFSDVDCDDENSQDFLGFNENELLYNKKMETNCRLSRDSGVSIDVPLTSLKDKNLEAIIEEGIDIEQTTKAVNNSDDCMNDLLAANENIQHSSETVQNLEEISRETEGTANAEVTTNNDKSMSENNEDAIATDDSDLFAQNDEDCNRRRNFAVIDDALNDGLEEIALASSKTKIQKWHEHLQPILAKSRERHHFDVFQIGTEIIDAMQAGKTADSDAEAKCISFDDIMHDKDPSYVSRYFLSSLLLANQGNVEINVQNQNSEQPSEWSDIQFELLSIKRHTVAIEDNIGMVNTKNKNKCTQQQKFPATTTSNYAEASQAKHSTSSKSNVLNVNLNVVKPLKQIEKLSHNSDDYDSGIFSSEEIVLS